MRTIVLLPLIAACSSPEPFFRDLPPVEPTPSDTGVVEPTDEPSPPPTPVDVERPVAQCSASSTTVLPYHEEVSFDGSASHDPNGVPIVAWAWELSERPQGSAAVMPSGGAVRDGFIADQAGLYVGRLVVTNADGVDSLACEVEIDAAPAQSLWIEMFWDQAGDDMDLHLFDPGADLVADKGTTRDCYFGNCKPSSPPLDWGVQGFGDDDPVLDQDDVLGTGPENINILAPAPGVYTVGITDFGVDTHIPSTQVTIKIHLDGQFVWEDTRTIVGDPQAVVPFATIDWPSGIVTTL